ncbi:MAG: ThuA domain-containing protein [Verrucomicrobiota bacterium]
MRSLLALLIAAVTFAAEPDRALVFSKTAGFRHKDSIPVGNELLKKQFESLGLQVDLSEDSAVFTSQNLARYRVVAFMSTTGDIMPPSVAKDAAPEVKAAAEKEGDARRKAFEQWMEAGGGFVGVHAASDTEYKWPWYGKMIGGYFNGHPAIQEAVLRPAVTDHPSTVHLPRNWKRRDEWYNFRKPMQRDIEILLTIDETSYDAGKSAMGSHHPMAWCKEVGQGRMFYTAGGHTKESFSEDLFVLHLLGGIRWVIRK